jgi:hypothetical protein
MKTSHFLIPLLCVFLQCTVDEDPVTTQHGYKPVYMDKEEARDIYYAYPRIIENPGKIYIKGKMIYINEKGKGIHFIDNSNPENPAKKGFLNIPGNHDIAIKGNALYADNFTDLVTIDISDMSEPKITKREYNAFPIEQQMYPANYSGYFECVDTSRGFVVEWIEADLNDPKCYR